VKNKNKHLSNDEKNVMKGKRNGFGAKSVEMQPQEINFASKKGEVCWNTGKSAAKKKVLFQSGIARVTIGGDPCSEQRHDEPSYEKTPF